MSSLNIKSRNTPLDKARTLVVKSIINSMSQSEMNISELATLSGTSRARITKVLKGQDDGISLDVLLRILQTIDGSFSLRLVSQEF